ncbi:MAG: hypothetical protein JSW07_02515 [bacterium]|nr:MAG: hypothetical protein JSW07_02515 [bacterium]
MNRKYYLSILLVFSLVFFSYYRISAFANDKASQKSDQSAETSIPNYGSDNLLFDKIQTTKDHTVASIDSSSSKNKKVYFTIRLGQGGFRDDRSPIGKLGGGQLTLDIKPSKYPIALSISNEYYTNSADPTHSYEIASLIAVNLLYMTKLFKSEGTTFFIGGGIGGLQVPKGEDKPDEMERGMLYNIETGVNVRVFWKIGLYGIGKYLYAMKEVKDKKVINFSEWIMLLGITFNSGL